MRRGASGSGNGNRSNKVHKETKQEEKRKVVGGRGKGRGNGPRKAANAEGEGSVAGTVADAGAAAAASSRAATTPAQVKAKPYDKYVCAGCNAKSEVTEWKAYQQKGQRRLVVGKGCVSCFCTWSASRQGDGDFDTVMELCETDPEYKKLFMQDNAVRKGSVRKDFHEADVDEVKASGVRVVKNLIGYTETQFEEAFGVLPKVVGLKLQDLVNESGKGFRGILMIDPNHPYCRYEITWDLHRRLASHRMYGTNHLHKGQDEDVFEVLVSEANERGKFAQKCRSCVLTKEEVRGMVQEALTNNSENDGDDAGLRGDGMEEEPEEKVVEHSMARGPALRESTVTPKLRRKGGTIFEGFGGAASVCDGASAIYSGAGDDEEGGDTGKKRKFSSLDHFNNMCIQKVLNGTPMARQTNFARAHAEKLPADDLYKGMLMERVELMEQGAKFMKLDIASVDDVQLMKELKPLVAAKVEMPTAIKMALLKRHVGTIASGRVAEFPLERFLSCVTPWRAEGTAVDEMCEFDLKEPTILAVEGSVKEKAAVFKDSLLNHFVVPLVRLGEDGVDTIVSQASSCVQALDPAFETELDDEYVSVLLDVVTALRAIIGLLDPMNFDYFTHAAKLCESEAAVSGKAHEMTVCMMLRPLMCRETFYKALIANFVETSSATRMHMPQVAKSMATLEGPAMVEVQDIMRMVEEWHMVSKSMRTGIGEAYMKKLKPNIETAMDGLKKVLDGAPDADRGISENLPGYVDLLTCVSKLLPEHFPNGGALAARARKAASAMQSSASLKSFVETAKKCADDGEIDSTSASDFAKLGATLRVSVDIQKEPKLKQELEGYMNQIVKTLMEHGFAEDPAVNNLVQVIKAGCGLFAANELQKERKVVKAVEDLSEAQAANQTLVKSGPDVASRLAAHESARHPSLLGLVVKLKAAQESANAVELYKDCFQRSFAKEAGTIGSCIDEHVIVLKEKVEAKYKEKKEAMVELSEGYVGGDKSWRASVTKSTVWADMQEMAEGSILKMEKGDMFQQAVYNYRSELMKYKDAAEMYSFKGLGEGFFDEGFALLSDALLLCLEVKVFISYKVMGDNSKELRKVLLAMQKEHPEEWPKLSDTMKMAVKAAIRVSAK